MVDGLSHRLSSQGPTLSIRSGYLTNLSVRTPRTMCSIAQSDTSVAKTKSYWRNRNHKAPKADSIFETGARAYKNLSVYDNRGSSTQGAYFTAQGGPPKHCDQPNMALKDITASQ